MRLPEWMKFLGSGGVVVAILLAGMLSFQSSSLSASSLSSTPSILQTTTSSPTTSATQPLTSETQPLTSGTQTTSSATYPNSPPGFVSPYPTYSWGNYGGCDAVISIDCPYNGNPTDFGANFQDGYMAIGNEEFALVGGESGWCGNANTTSSKVGQHLALSGSLYNPATEATLVEYQVPYFIGEPLNGYGGCGTPNFAANWSSETITQYPDLMTYNSNGTADNVAYMTNSCNNCGWVRVDDISFVNQILADLINIKNNILAADPAFIHYWWGVQDSQIAADEAGYPLNPGEANPPHGFMWGNASVINFAESPLCLDGSVNSTYSSCSYLASAAQGQATSVTGSPCCSTRTIYQIVSAFHGHNANSSEVDGFGQWPAFTDAGFYLGIVDALNQFNQRYSGLIGHDLYFYPAESYFLPSQFWPAPYNGLNPSMLQKLEIRVKTSVFGGSTTLTTADVQRDVSDCQLPSYGNEGIFGALPFVSTGGPNPTNQQELITASVAPYYIAACSPWAIVNLGQYVPSTSSAGWTTLYAYGQILDRMQYLGISQVTPASFSATDPTTKLSTVTGKGYTLAWFYTNATSQTTASATFAESLASCVAISALSWSVVGTCNGSSIGITITIPAHGWNPVYIVPSQPSGSVAYSNVPLISEGGGSYVFNSPHAFSDWAVISESSPPTSVSVGQPYSSLQSLNSTLIGYSSSGVQSIQQGWFYDSMNDLLYIHFAGDNSVEITISYDPSGTSSTTSTSTTSSSTTSIPLSTASSSTETTASSLATVTSTFSTATTSLAATTTETSMTLSTGTTSTLTESTPATLTISGYTTATATPGYNINRTVDASGQQSVGQVIYSKGGQSPGSTVNSSPSSSFLNLPMDSALVWGAFIVAVGFLVAGGVRASRHDQ